MCQVNERIQEILENVFLRQFHICRWAMIHHMETKGRCLLDDFLLMQVVELCFTN